MFLSVPKWNRDRVYPIPSLEKRVLDLDAASVVLRLCSANKY